MRDANREMWDEANAKARLANGYVGIVERHYLLCPFCGGRADLIDHRCLDCGALAVAIVWEPSTPELALVGAR